MGQDGRGEGEHRDGRRRHAAASTDRRRTALPGKRAGGAATGLTGSILAPRADAVPRAGPGAHPRSSLHAGQGRDGPRRRARRV